MSVLNISVSGYKKFVYDDYAPSKISGLQKVNYLVGNNNVGKSSFLEAILLSTLGYDKVSHNFPSGGVGQNYANYVDFFHDNSTKNTIKVEFLGYESDRTRFVEMTFNSSRRSISKTVKEEGGGSKFPDLPKTLYIPCKPQFKKEISTMHGDSLRAQIENIGELPANEILAHIYNEEKRKLEQKEITKLGESDQFKRLQSIVTDLFKITLIAPDVLEGTGEKTLMYTDSTSKIEKPMYLLGSGTKTTLTLLAAIVYSEHELILIDEPELHLSAYFEKQLPKMFYEVAKKFNKQIIIATQSPFVISKVGDLSEQRIFLFKEENGKISIHDKFEDKTMELAVTMELGSNDPGAVGIPQNFILTEENSLQQILQDVNERIYKKNLQFISCTGIDDTPNKSHAFKNFIDHSTILKCTPVYHDRFLVIVDQLNDDDKQDNNLKKLQKQLKDRFIELDKPDIEEYYSDSYLQDFAKENNIKINTEKPLLDFIKNWIAESVKYQDQGKRKEDLALFISKKINTKEEFEQLFPLLGILFR